MSLSQIVLCDLIVFLFNNQSLVTIDMNRGTLLEMLYRGRALVKEKITLDVPSLNGLCNMRFDLIKFPI